MSCFFSVIIPVYNTEKYLNQCVDSVLSQTFCDYEIILVNDGSKDNSASICDEYAKNNERVKVIHKENGGLSSARNAGVDSACGEYILFLDSDDYYYTDNAFELMAEKLKPGNADVLSFKALKYFTDSGRFVDHYGDYDVSKRQIYTAADAFRYMLKTNKQLVSACNKAVKKSVLTDNGIEFEQGTISEDTEWTVRLFSVAKTADFINGDFYVYRQGVGNSITSSFPEKNFNDLYRVVKKIADEHKKKNDDFSRAVMSFAAFEYAIILYNLSSYNNYKDYKYVQEYKFLLKYATDKKTKLIKTVYALFGYNGLMRILKFARGYL